MAMSEPTSPRDELVALLGEHGSYMPLGLSLPGDPRLQCRCGELTRSHGGHLADVLIAAGWSKALPYRVIAWGDSIMRGEEAGEPHEIDREEFLRIATEVAEQDRELLDRLANEWDGKEATDD